MSDVNCNVSDETLQYCKEFLEKYPEAPNWDKSFVEPLMISFIANKKKREKRKSHADYCKTYDKKRKLNSNTDMGHSSRNNTTQKGEKLSTVERQRLCRLRKKAEKRPQAIDARANTQQNDSYFH